MVVPFSPAIHLRKPTPLIGLIDILEISVVLIFNILKVLIFLKNPKINLQLFILSLNPIDLYYFCNINQSHTIHISYEQNTYSSMPRNDIFFLGTSPKTMDSPRMSWLCHGQQYHTTAESNFFPAKKCWSGSWKGSIMAVTLIQYQSQRLLPSFQWVNHQSHQWFYVNHVIRNQLYRQLRHQC